MPTGATDLGFDVVANQPQTELNYRVLVDTSGTEASLASINAIQQAGGGGRLAFSTDAADGPLAQRMLIDNQGNVGIGTENPGASLHVAGDAKFNGPLVVQGALTASRLEVSGVAKIDGGLSVTGRLTAASFAGNGAGLSNVTPADNSITSAKLAVDSASLSKVTGGKMVISADNVGIGTANPGARLDVAGDAKFNGPLNVQGALTVGGAARIGGDLSVTGRLTAASFAGNGAGLSNVTPADNSITSAKLAEDAASLSKVTGGKMVISPDRLDVAGYMALNGPLNVLGGFTAGSAMANPVSQIYGNLHVQGRLSASNKSFVIDHPLDPANKYLYHSSVESPDVMNIYNGNIITDTEGNATVVLPGYFEALNADFRYQLTVIGKLAQAAVAGEIESNRFTVKTNQPNVKVSWQVTGIRQDASAKAHRLPVEEEKPEGERGLFLHPEDYGQPKTKGIAFVHSPETHKPMLGRANHLSAY